MSIENSDTKGKCRVIYDVIVVIDEKYCVFAMRKAMSDENGFTSATNNHNDMLFSGSVVSRMSRKKEGDTQFQQT